MFLRSLLLFVFSCHIAMAQDTTNVEMRVHDIFDGKATIEIPDEYIVQRLGTFFVDDDGNSLVEHDVTYFAPKHIAVISCYLLKGKLSQEDIYGKLQEYKNIYNSKYLDILRDEFVANGDNSYGYYECVLKDEYYSEAGSPALELEDGHVSPNYFQFYFTINNGKTTQLVIHYDGEKAGLNDFRQLANNVIASYKFL